MHIFLNVGYREQSTTLARMLLPRALVRLTAVNGGCMQRKQLIDVMSKWWNGWLGTCSRHATRAHDSTIEGANVPSIQLDLCRQMEKI
jgi:hypothetical protein